jgi:thiol:disulfide interchange protein DsbA
MIRTLMIALSLLAVPLAGQAQLPASATAAPRLGVDYELMDTPQPDFSSGAGIEVVEVFSYRCSHCAQFQPVVDAWRKRHAAGVRWVYVPGAFGGSWDSFARAYYAAENLGVLDKTHDAVFRGVFEQHLVTTGTPAEIADMYARFGLDRARFLDTMASEGVSAKLEKAREFALRTGIQGTPTLIVSGKYRLAPTTDRGFDGMISTLDFLLAKERAEARARKKQG